MAKSKAKFNPKDFLVKKGEYLALGLAGFGLVILIALGLSAWGDAADPKKLADDLNNGSNGIVNQIKTAQAADIPTETWEGSTSNYKPVPLRDFASNGLPFDPIGTPDTKRENPLVEPLGEYQAELIRGPMMAYDIISADDRLMIAMLAEDKKKPYDPKLIKKAAEGLNIKPKKGARPERKEPMNPGGPGQPPGATTDKRPSGLGAQSGFDADSKRSDLKIVYVPVDEVEQALEDKKTPAFTVIPVRMAVINCEFPLKKQREEFIRALRLPKDQPFPKNLEPVFEGYEVQRRVTPPKPAAVEEWADYNYIKPYRLNINSRRRNDVPDLVFNGYLPYFLRYQEGLALPLPELIKGLGNYPPVVLPGIKAGIAKLEAANRPRQTMSDFATALSGSGTKGVFLPQTGDDGKKDQPRKEVRPDSKDTPETPIEIDTLLVRFVDSDIKPGYTYEYRIRVLMKNPNFGQTELVANPEYATEAYKTLYSPWREIDTPLTIPQEYFLFAYSPAAYREQIDQAFKPAGKNTPLHELMQAKPSQAVIEVQTWTEQVKTDSGGKREPVGSWVVAEMPVGRGEYVGRKQYVKLPIWSSEHKEYIFRETPDEVIKAPRGSKKPEQPPGWLVDFTTRAVLVDFEGGTVQTKVGGRVITEECETELLIAQPDGRLLVRSSNSDMSDKERQARTSVWAKWLGEVEQRRAGTTTPGSTGPSFDRNVPKN